MIVTDKSDTGKSIVKEERISVFDIFKIGVGPSSSHTLGPWRAGQLFVKLLESIASLNQVISVEINLYGSLAKTGKGHGTDLAVQLGLCGYDPVTMDTKQIDSIKSRISDMHKLHLNGSLEIDFNPKTDIVFQIKESLPFHPNALTFIAALREGEDISETYYSVGGGFVIKEEKYRYASEDY